MARSRIVDLSNFQQFTAINVLTDPGHIGGPVVIPNGIQVTLAWTLADGKAAHNVLYGTAGGSFTPTAALADQFFTALTSGANWTALAAVLATTTSLVAVRLRDVRTPNLPLISSVGAAHAGTDAVQSLPNEVAAAITFRTALAGIANRGRMYVPGFGTDTVTNINTISSPAITALSNWTTNITSAFSAIALVQVIAHPARAAYTGVTGTQHPARAAGSVPVTQLLMRDNTWDTIRRRGLK